MAAGLAHLSCMRKRNCVAVYKSQQARTLPRVALQAVTVRLIYYSLCNDHEVQRLTRSHSPPYGRDAQAI